MRKINKNKALFVMPTDSVGGAERVALSLIRYLLQNKIFDRIDLLFICKGRNGGWQELEGNVNLNIYYKSYKSERASLPFVAYFLLLNRKEYNFVYSSHVHINAFLSLAKYLSIFLPKHMVARESTVISDRFSGIKLLVFKGLYKFYRRHDLLILQTQYMKQKLLENHKHKLSDRIEVIPNPIAFENIRSSLKIYKVNEQLRGKGNNSFTIIMIGRLVSVKNHHLMLQAITQLVQQEKIADGFKLKIVGDGPLSSQIKNTIKESNLFNYVELMGYVQSPYQLMSGADVGILTSLKEGFPNVLLEMMASGTKHIITTPCAGDLDKLAYVHVLKDFDVNTLCLAIQQAIDNRYDYSKQFIKQASNRDVSGYWAAINQNLN